MQYDVIVIGAGAAGLMCAIEAGRRGRRVLLLDHAGKVGKKILISGGGRCNFTNLHAAPDRFLSQNPHFSISALRRYTQQDFIALVRSHGIAFHEKTLGQLFCDGSAREIVDMLLAECAAAGVEIRLNVTVGGIAKGDSFRLESALGELSCASLVVATGGLSIPKMGATGFGYGVARRFGIPVTETRPGLVPFTFTGDDPRTMKDLTGLAFDAELRCDDVRFREAVLCTHRGLSGPAVLQVSSYWREGMPVEVDFLPGIDAGGWIADRAAERPKAELKTVLAELLPRRLAERLVEIGLPNRPLNQYTQKEREAAADMLSRFTVVPSGTEGYRTAEVTVGGVATDGMSSKTMEAKSVPGLYFIGEVVDVTGWLGGYNFQWAWSSGWCAGQFV